MDISDKNRIHKYFNDSSIDDENFLASQFLKESNVPEMKEVAQEHWEKASSKEVELQHILDRIHFHINTSKDKRPVLSRILSAYYRVAAVLLIPLIIGGIYMMVQNSTQSKSYAEISAPQGSRVQFTLPDGSMGHLNGGSRLKYPINFSNNRNVSLSGEAYFEVTKDKKHPFTVQTKYADVLVFGTKFDVCAYEGEQEVFTTLEEGSVKVFNKTEKTSATLNPGEQNVISTSNGKMQNIPVKTNLYTSWKDEMLRFNNSPFDEVIKKMERWYGIKINLDKSLKYSENYTFTVRTESLKELLELLSITTPMSYRIDNDTVIICPLKKKSIN
ncbi:MAG: FecR family protein [Prolixibacteraceae bacterium]|nr:FecR family protein [Prolixibacteraceae bacterium]